MRSGAQKLAQHCGQNIIGGRSYESKIKGPADPAADALGREHGLVRPRQNLARTLEKDLPCGSDLHPAPVAKQQLHQQIFFERLYLAAESGLGDAQSLGGVSEM